LHKYKYRIWVCGKFTATCDAPKKGEMIMFDQKRLTVLTLSIILALLFAAVMPLAVLADDGVSPTTDVPAVVDEPVVDAPVVTDEPVVDAPVVTDEPVVDAPVVTDEPVVDAPLIVDEPVVDAPVVADELIVDASVVDVPAVEDPSTLPEILDAAPDGTELVVLDQSGEPLPLASEAAASTLEIGDPMWCPDSVLPGGAGCTGSFSSFGALITELKNGTGSDVGAGTIYIASNYNATTAGDAGTNIVFDYGAMNLTNLVLQGGWNFSTNTLAGTSTINLGLANNLQFYNWAGSLTLNNIVVTNSERLLIDGSGLDGVSTADVTMNNVNVTNTKYGALLSTSGDVVINDSAFTGSSQSDGVMFWGVRDATITNSVFTGNAERGARIWVSGNAEIANSAFNGNQEGAGISSGGNVTITNSDFNDNSNMGGDVATFNGHVTIIGSDFSGNDNGLQVMILRPLSATAVGNVVLDNVTVTGNKFNGASINADQGYITDSHGNELFNTGNIFISGGNFSGNGQSGLEAYSWDGNYAVLNNVTAMTNRYLGAYVYSEGGSVSVNGGNFSGNSSAGVMAYGHSGVILNNVFAIGNGGGAEATSNVGSVIVDGGNFSNNRGNGLGAFSDSDVVLNNVTAVGNSSFGASASAHNVTVNGGNFSYNGLGGLWAGSSGITKFNNVTAIGNGDGSIFSFGAGAYGNLEVFCGNYSDNMGYGLWIDAEDGNANLRGPVLNGNTRGGYYLNSGTVSAGLCPAVDTGERGFKSQNGQLPVSPVIAETTSLTVDQLPANLPEGKTFVAELTVKLMQNGEEVDSAPSGVQVIFDIPAGTQGTFTVLLWDGAKWIEIASTVVNGKVVFMATQPGIYVLSAE
jgi:hypothetical protein